MEHAWDHRGRNGALEVERVQHVAQYALLNLRAPAHPGLSQRKALVSSISSALKAVAWLLLMYGQRKPRNDK